MEVLQLLLNYAAAPLAAICWYMFKRQDMRLDQLERKTNNLEMALTKIETELQFISRDIKDIRDLLKVLNKKGLV